MFNLPYLFSSKAIQKTRPSNLLSFGRVVQWMSNAKVLGPKDKKIQILWSDFNNIHFNLATEEYLYEHCELKYPTLFLWRNDRTIVIGRHQNPWKECFIQNMEKDGINLARRRTGGGAVYQDLGNSCFSFLTPIFGDAQPLEQKQVSNKILLAALKNADIEAEVSGRNDILFQGKKISGSAYQISLGKTDGTGKKALHHGTMLLNVKGENVQLYLNPNKEKLKSKGVTSVISRIINLNTVKPELDHNMLCRLIEEEFIKYYPDHEIIKEQLHYDSLSKLPQIEKIYKELKSWEWVYGNTPKFTNHLETRFAWGIVDINLQVQNNVIVEAKVWSDCLYVEFITSINRLLSECKFTYDESGVQQFCHLLRMEHHINSELITYVDALEEWMKKSI